MQAKKTHKKNNQNKDHIPYMHTKRNICLISTKTRVNNRFAPVLCGNHGNSERGSYRGHLFIKEGEKKNNDRIQIFIYNRCHEFITEVRFVQRTEYKPSSLTVYHQIHNHKSKPSQRKRWRKQDALGECTDESVSSLYYSVTMFKVWCWHSNNAFLGGLTKTSSNLRQRTSMLNGKLLRHRNWLKWLSISEFAVFVSVEEPVKRAGAEYQTIFRRITTSMRPQCQCGEWEMTMQIVTMFYCCGGPRMRAGFPVWPSCANVNW